MASADAKALSQEAASEAVAEGLLGAEAIGASE